MKKTTIVIVLHLQYYCSIDWKRKATLDRQTIYNIYIYIYISHWVYFKAVYFLSWWVPLSVRIKGTCACCHGWSCWRSMRRSRSYRKSPEGRSCSERSMSHTPFCTDLALTTAYTEQCMLPRNRFSGSEDSRRRRRRSSLPPRKYGN